MQSHARTIVMVTNNYFPYQSGVAQSVHASTQALIDRGHTVALVTLDVTDTYHDPSYVIRVPSIIRMRLKNNPLALPLYADSFLKKLIAHIRPDLIHTHHPWLLGYSALKAARAQNLPVIFTHHTLYEAYTHYVPLPKPLVSLCIKKRVRMYCSAVDHIIAPSTAVAHTIAIHTNTTALSVIPSPIRACFLSDAPYTKRTKKRISLLYVGRFVPEKNVAAILDAVALLPPDSYTLTCVGYGYLWQALQEYAYTKLQLGYEQVQFHTKAHEAELVAWYRQADLFLFASATDTQGLVLAESMACGTPVIAFDGPGQRSIVHTGYNGYIVQNSGEMAQKILFLMHNYQHLVQLSTGARATATQYTTDAHAQRLMALYETVITQRGSGCA